MSPADLTLLLAALAGLASPAFHDRETAARRLAAGPGWQTGVILAATAHADPEVAGRARAVADRRGFTKEAEARLRAKEVARRMVLKHLWSKRGGYEVVQAALTMDPYWAGLVGAEAVPIARRLGLWFDGRPPDRWTHALESGRDMGGSGPILLAAFLARLTPPAAPPTPPPPPMTTISIC